MERDARAGKHVGGDDEKCMKENARIVYRFLGLHAGCECKIGSGFCGGHGKGVGVEARKGMELECKLSC